MKHRLTRLLKVLEWYPRTGAPDVDAIALQLGTTPSTIRRDLRDLREAGAFDGGAIGLVEAERDVAMAERDVSSAIELPAHVLSIAPANDGASLPSQPLGDDELVAMYVGARFLAAEGGGPSAAGARAVIERVEHAAGPALLERLAEADARFRFGPRASERRLRLLVTQAISERRVVRFGYRGERDSAYREREVEPLAQFFLHDRWSFVGYCRTAGDFRQFRHERCRDVRLSDEYFIPRGGFTLENFIQRRKVAGERGGAVG